MTKKTNRHFYVLCFLLCLREGGRKSFSALCRDMPDIDNEEYNGWTACAAVVGYAKPTCRMIMFLSWVRGPLSQSSRLLAYVASSAASTVCEIVCGFGGRVTTSRWADFYNHVSGVRECINPALPVGCLTILQRFGSPIKRTSSLDYVRCLPLFSKRCS